MPDRPRDEREFQAELEARTPTWIPGVTARVSFRRLWDKRLDAFVDSVTEKAGSSRVVLSERIDEDNGFADIFMVAAARAGEVGDRQYSDVLSSLVAAALIDDAKIDGTAYLVDRIAKLQPVHIRIMAALKRKDGQETSTESIFESKDMHSAIRTERVADLLSVHQGVIESCLNELVEVGFIYREEGDVMPMQQQRPDTGGQRLPTSWRVSNLGFFGINEIYRILEGLTTPSEAQQP